MLQKLSSCRWNLAFIDESMDEILSGRPVHLTQVHNPYADECWFADPFILDVTPEYIYLLVEDVPYATSKGVIAKLTILRKTMTITHVETVLEEPWHLSFPNIMRKDGHIYVYPESAGGEKLFLYELVESPDGKTTLQRVKTLCDDEVWDSDMTDLFGEPLLFTAHQNDFHLDIYTWNNASGRFVYSESIESSKQDMRMAGSLFEHHGAIIYPSQISTPYVYGQAVKLREISLCNGEWQLKDIRTIHPPKGLLSRGLHTFNSYKGLTVVDTTQYNHLAGPVINKLVAYKKKLSKLLK